MFLNIKINCFKYQEYWLKNNWSTKLSKLIKNSI